MIYSFDVFDTCVTRMHAYPRDLFFDLGLRLAPATADEAVRRRFARRFQRARIRAEKLANWRSRPHRENAGIFAIYDNLHYLMRLDKTSVELVEAELTLEEESIYPIAETVERIKELRHAGHRILFVSDMYIPAQLLEPILVRKGVMLKGDKLYVSCDSGVTKHSGKLFAHVLKQEALSGSDLLHTGDSRHADIHNATVHSILSRHFSAAHLGKHEARIAGAKPSRGPGASWLAGFSRRCRISMRHALHEPEHPLDGAIFGVIVPFLLAYVQWVLDDAHRRGIERLYFVARDGEILFKIAKELNHEDMDLRYLYGSRRAWLAPSITQERPEWKRLLVVPGNASAPQDIVARAGLDAAAQAKLRDVLGMDDTSWKRSLGLDEASLFVENLARNPISAELLRVSAHEKRELALMYFKQEGLLDESSWALVDAGWSLNSQAALKRILDHVDAPHQLPRGYYLGLARDHLGETQAGKAFSFLTPAGSIFSRRRVVVEHCFLPATHPSTYAYKLDEEKVLPEFGSEARSATELAYARHLQKGAMQAARTIAQSPDLRNCLKLFMPEICREAENFICHPSHADALAMAEFTAIADMRQERLFAQPLCRPLQMKDVWATMLMALSRSRNFKSNAWMWLEGSVALSSFLVRVPMRSMLWLDSIRNRLSLRN